MVNQRGAISLPVILSVVFGLGLCASAYLNYVQHESAQTDHKLLQGTITDLRYQVNKDQQAAAAVSTSTPLATPEPSATPIPSSSPSVAGTGSVTISQFGVKLTVADPVADLTYDMTTSGAFSVAGLSTRSLISKYAGCKPSTKNNALGYIVRKSAKPGVTSSGVKIKQLGAYNYYYIAPYGFCATDRPGQDALAAARAAIKNAVLPTLSN